MRRIKSVFFFKRYWMTIVVTTTILFLCFTSGTAFEKIPAFPNTDKIIHFLMFMGLTVVFVINLRNESINDKFKLRLSFVYPIILGLVIEIVQGYFIPLRSGDIIDWLFDIAGVVCGFYIARGIINNVLQQK